MPENAKAVLERFYAAMMAWDEDELRAVLTEDAELHQPPTLPYGRIYRGPDEMIELWKNVILPMANPEKSFVDFIIADDEHAAVVAGSEMNGKPVLACEDYLVRDGRIARIRMFWFDPTPVAEAAAAAGVTAG
jgi:ketosteroid isomerase-like protein